MKELSVAGKASLRLQGLTMARIQSRRVLRDRGDGGGGRALPKALPGATLSPQCTEPRLRPFLPWVNLCAVQAVSIKHSYPTFHSYLLRVNPVLVNTKQQRVQSISEQSKQETRPTPHVFSCTYFCCQKSAFKGSP